MIINIFAFVFTLLLLIGIHEWGHFWVARRCGVKTLCFSIGFGRSLWQHKAKDGTIYRIAILPLGGYVRLLDEHEGPVATSERHLAFNRQPIYKRFLIVAAGPFINFIFAIAAFWGVYVLGFDSTAARIGHIAPTSIAAKAGMKDHSTIVAIDGHETPHMTQVIMALIKRLGNDGTMLVTTKETPTPYKLNLSNWQLDALHPDPLTALGITPYQAPIPPIIDQVLANSPAAQAGLQQGDTITQINQQPITDWRELIAALQHQANQPMQLHIQRQQQTLELAITPKPAHWFSQQGRLGVQVQPPAIPPDMHQHTQLGPLSALAAAWQHNIAFCQFHAIALYKMVRGDLSILSLGGPLTIYGVSKMAFHQGAVAFLRFLGILSGMLAVLNVLPIPGLDGGHMLFIGIESIRRKALSIRIQNNITRVGMACLLLLMAQATINDIIRLF